MALKEYYEKMEEYVYDVQRAVTPRWLSRELGLSIGTAKKLLEEFYTSEKSKKRSKSVTAIYVVSGVPKTSSNNEDDEPIEVTLVPENKWAEKVKQFDKVSKSIYCLYPSDLTVSPSSSIVNANCEHALDSKEDFGKYDRVFSKASVAIRTEQEIEDLRRNAFKSGESLGFTKHTPATSSTCHPPKKANSIASSFAKAATSKPPTKSESDPVAKIEEKPTQNVEPVAVPLKVDVKKKPVSNQKAKAGSSSLTAMFSRQVEKNKTAPPKPKPEPKKEIPKPELEKETPEPPSASHKRTRSKEPAAKEETELSPKKSPPPKKAKTRNTKKKPTKKPPPPKRKRVTALLSSSSESESDEEEQDKLRRGDAMEVEPEPEAEAPAPDLVSSDEEEVVLATPKEERAKKGKHKVKRWVDKTFLDDEGFMVTEKVMEEVEEDDVEAEQETEHEPEKKPGKAPPAECKSPEKSETDKENKKGSEEGGKTKGRPKKTASVSTGKQSSIMNFFSKAK